MDVGARGADGAEHDGGDGDPRVAAGVRRRSSPLSSRTSASTRPRPGCSPRPGWSRRSPTTSVAPGAARRRPGHGRELGADSRGDRPVDALIVRLFPLATVVTPNLPRRSRSRARRLTRQFAERLHEPRRPAVIVTEATASRPSITSSTVGARRDPVERHGSGRRTAPADALGDAGGARCLRTFARAGGRGRRPHRLGGGPSRPRRARPRRRARRR